MLTFYDKGHIYILDGERIPCVSDLCRFIHKEVYKETPQWRMEEAAARGTAVHLATEILDRTGQAQTEEDYLPYLQAYALFRKEHEAAWELIEHSDYHPEHRYAGTIDRYGVVDGLITLVDIKTTYSVMKPLCSASLNLYRMILEARQKAVDRLMVLHLKKDGTYKLIKFDFDDSVPLALITLNTATQRRKRGKKNERRDQE